MPLNFSPRAAALTASLLALSACGGGSDSPAQPPANRAPQVNAGATQTVDEYETVTLSGTASDADGDAVTLSWRQTAGPAVELRDGQVGLRLKAEVEGLLERVSFTLEADAGGVVGAGERSGKESGSVRLQGRLVRSEKAGGELQLEHGRATVDGGGCLEFEGRLAPLFSEAPTELNLTAGFHDVRPGKLLAYLPEELRTSLPLQLDASDGAGTSLPFVLDFNTPNGGGFFGSGFGGVQLSSRGGGPVPGLVGAGGAGGLLAVSATDGTHEGGANDQDNALQQGFPVTGRFRVATGLSQPFPGHIHVGQLAWIRQIGQLPIQEPSGLLWGSYTPADQQGAHQGRQR